MYVMSAFNMSRHLTLTRRSEKPFLMESVLIVQYNTIQYNTSMRSFERRLNFSDPTLGSGDTEGGPFGPPHQDV